MKKEIAAAAVATFAALSSLVLVDEQKLLQLLVAATFCLFVSVFQQTRSIAR